MSFTKDELIAMCATDIREGVRRSAAEALYALGQADCMHEVQVIRQRPAQVEGLTPKEREWMAEGEKEQA